MSKLNVTNEPNQPADPEETPVPIKKLRELTTRYSQALQDDGPVALASELRTTMLYQVHKHLLDKLAKSAEPDVVQHTTELGGLTIDSQHRKEGVEYVPTPHRVVDWVQDVLPEDKPNWTFIDVGAGRGRVVAAAARHPYRQVIGIEFAAELYNDAKQHLETMAQQSIIAERVDIIHADAASFEIPDGPCVFYLFNPFGPLVLRKFMTNVISSHQARPRQMQIAYVNPKHSSVMAEFSQVHECNLPMAARLKFAALSPNDFALYTIA